MAAETAKKFVIPFKTPRPQKLVLLGKPIGDDATGTLEVESIGMLKTGERAMIEDADLWEFEQIDSAVSKLAKSIYDREKAAGKPTKLSDIDLAIRRLQDEAYPENEIKAEASAIVLKGAFEKAKTPGGAVAESMVLIRDEFESFLELMKQFPAPSAQKDREILEEYMDEVKALSRERADQADRRWDVYAQMIAWYRLGLEGITIDELRDAIGVKLMFRLGLFGVYEGRGETYVEDKVFVPSIPEPVEARSDEAILKP